MRRILLPGVIGLLVVSFGFLGGWPFVGQEKTPELEKEVEEAAEHDGGHLSALPAGAEQRPAEHGDSLVKEEGAPAVPAAVRQCRERLALARGRGLEVERTSLSQAILDRSLPGSFRRELLGRLRQLNRETVFQPGRDERAVDVRIKGGDSLTRIARRVKKTHGNNITPAFLMKMNRLPNTRIRAGNLLSVPTESLKVVISKSDFRLYVLLGETIVLDYPVGIGREDSTPEGNFFITGKTKNPTWTRPDGKVIPFGDPEHTIGTRWLGFATDRGRTPYGIHGTVENDSIGKARSEGCIRMRKDDVEEIFRLIPEGCPVTIVP